MLDQICQSCLLEAENQHSNPDNHVGLPSLGFFHNIAIQLHFPFQSIALLTDCARSRKANKFSIRIAKMQNSQDLQLPAEATYQQNYLQIKFDGQILTNQQAHLIANFMTMPYFDFSFYFRIGVLGLGKTCLLVCNDGKYRKLILLSVDDRVNPTYKKSPCSYLYIEQIQSGKIENIGGEHQKKIILQICKLFHIDRKILFECTEKQFKLFIFHGKIFVTSKKIMFYELSESQFNRDIQIYHNALKIQFLNKIGYQLANHAEISFASYYSLLYLNSDLKVFIGNSQQQFHGLTYESYLLTLQKNGMIKRIQCSFKQTQKCMLFQAKQNYFAHNNGILLYSEGRLINRYQTDFGKMMEQCFYRKKYRQPPQNIFNYLGIFDFNEEMQTNLLRTKFHGSSPKYHKFILQLREIIENNQQIEKKIKLNIQEQDIRVTRSIARQNNPDRKDQSAYINRRFKDDDQFVWGQPKKKVKQ